MENISKTKGSLLVAGTGITSIAHLTLEAVSAIEKSDTIFFLVADQLTINWLLEKRSDAISLYHHYEDGKDRIESYEGMVEEILTEVRLEKEVLAIFYGHPGVFVYPSHVAIEKAKKEGFYARMLPGISADACMIADIGVDPATHGWQAYEATYFLVNNIKIDISSPLILWQIGVVGDLKFSPGDFNKKALLQIKDKLNELYGRKHSACIYEASEFSVLRPKILWTSIGEIEENQLTPISTLFIPTKT
jgi:hypothetical protein